MKRPKTEAAKALSKWLSGLKRSRSMVWRSGTFVWSEEIETRLRTWCATIDDPCDGCLLLLDFFRGDEVIFCHCDDSNGMIGDLFKEAAKDLFTRFAARCPDKDWLVAQLLELLREDGYGVRDCLLEDAQRFLPESSIRALVAGFQAEADAKESDSDKRHWWIYIEMLARALKDATLFERTRLASWGTLNSAAYVEIAQIWFASGDAATARAWLDKVPQGDNFRDGERDALLVRVAQAQGDLQTRDAAAWRMFRRHRTVDALKTLLAVIGPQSREAVVDQEAEAILATPGLNLDSVWFLVELGRIDQAEAYLLQRAALLDGSRYGDLAPLAKALVEHRRALVATLMYRALLDSLLERALSKSYGHAARYLQTLERLAPRVSDWQGFADHRTYEEALKRSHARKSAFWSRFKG